MPVIDWLEELLKAAEGDSELENLVESEAVLLKTMETAALTERPELGSEQMYMPDAGKGVMGEQAAPEYKARTGQMLGAGRFQTTVSEGGSLIATGRVRALQRKAESETAVQRLYQSSTGSALSSLYHQVRETVSLGLQSASEREKTVIVREEVPIAGGLTEEKLDRSLRRDSRRYDGSMSIY